MSTILLDLTEFKNEVRDHAERAADMADEHGMSIEDAVHRVLDDTDYFMYYNSMLAAIAYYDVESDAFNGELDYEYCPMMLLWNDIYEQASEFLES